MAPQLRWTSRRRRRWLLSPHLASGLDVNADGDGDPDGGGDACAGHYFHCRIFHHHLPHRASPEQLPPKVFMARRAWLASRDSPASAISVWVWVLGSFSVVLFLELWPLACTCASLRTGSCTSALHVRGRWWREAWGEPY